MIYGKRLDWEAGMIQGIFSRLQLVNISSIHNEYRPMISPLTFRTSNLVWCATVHRITYITFSSELYCYPKPFEHVTSLPTCGKRYIHGIWSKWKFFESTHEWWDMTHRTTHGIKKLAPCLRQDYWLHVVLPRIRANKEINPGDLCNSWLSDSYFMICGDSRAGRNIWSVIMAMWRKRDHFECEVRLYTYREDWIWELWRVLWA
jgi:hypothetical protein